MIGVYNPFPIPREIHNSPRAGARALFHFSGWTRTTCATDTTADNQPMRQTSAQSIGRWTSQKLTTILPRRDTTEFFISNGGSLYEPACYGRDCTVECTDLR